MRQYKLCDAHAHVYTSNYASTNTYLFSFIIEGILLQDDSLTTTP